MRRLIQRHPLGTSSAARHRARDEAIAALTAGIGGRIATATAAMTIPAPVKDVSHHPRPRTPTRGRRPHRRPRLHGHIAGREAMKAQPQRAQLLVRLLDLGRLAPRVAVRPRRPTRRAATSCCVLVSPRCHHGRRRLRLRGALEATSSSSRGSIRLIAARHQAPQPVQQRAALLLPRLARQPRLRRLRAQVLLLHLDHPTLLPAGSRRAPLISPRSQRSSLLR